MLGADLVHQIGELEALRPGWDELAVAAGRPLTAPAWLLAWWRNVRPPSARLRTPIVLDGNRLVGIMPCFVEHQRPGFVEYRLLGAGEHRIDPPVHPGMEDVVAPLIAKCLAASHPPASTLRLEGLDASSPWPQLLRRYWDGRIRPWVHRDVMLPAPTLSLAGSDYEGWLASKSQNFRKDMRRKRRRLMAQGASIRMIEDAGELKRAIDAMLRLHHVRWARRGGSQAIGEREERLLRDAAPEMLANQRLRLWVIESEQRVVAAHVCFAAGGTVASWSGGFDDEWSRFSPELVLLTVAIEDAFRRRDSVFDLGGGDYLYKRRFADGDAPVAWFTLFPRGRRYPLARAHTLPRHTFWRTRAWAREHLRPETRERLKVLLRRR